MPRLPVLDRIAAAKHGATTLQTAGLVALVSAVLDPTRLVDIVGLPARGP